ncbi:ABC transporter permease [Oricola cellulosilytica]|uniref:ABC transporter permease n=1 Tax=Oricola cellulosilytica TaxID=1429082 RepID=A0A4R0PH11_9HYPH|nr:ABC transporter permease [Oricola cellulosilytica]TCD16163.1 ABC transporter permease [Oricola cellulosilytica]
MESLSTFEIIFQIVWRFWPVWLSLVVAGGLSYVYRSRLGLYGHLFDTSVGVAGVLFVGFWVFTAIFAGIIAPFDPIGVVPIMKNAAPGAVDAGSGEAFLLGGDKLARDVFSRMVFGSRIVLVIAPAATAFALMVGITLGLPAGYYGGKIDSTLSFLANLVLAFPVILLFYLLVTPGIIETPIPYSMAGLFFVFPIIFFVTLFYTRYQPRPMVMWTGIILSVVVGVWVWVSLVSNEIVVAALYRVGLSPLGWFFDLPVFKVISIEPGQLNIFVAVVFASSPGVFRIVRGLVMDIKTRDYVAAAQTRGESPWYIMLWEVLPNSRGPLIVDACLRIGYTTILLGTLGYFGLGMPPESPDWGTAIKDGSQLLRLTPWPAIVPAIALMSFVLGLNLLADALREESLKD